MAGQFFITGMGTGIGKKVILAIVARALDADYWKPVQAGYTEGTDSEWVEARVPGIVVHPEVYKLKMPASPHIAAREEGVSISLSNIAGKMPLKNRNLIIEGPGGLMVPLNGQEFVTDLIRTLDIPVILVSRNYLGSINHSLLTSELCRQKHIAVSGWVFNDQYLSYEHEIVSWSGFPALGSVPFNENIDAAFIEAQAERFRKRLATII